jgi:hypothetical protein
MIYERIWKSLLVKGITLRAVLYGTFLGGPAMEYRLGMLASERGSRTEKQAVLLKSEYILVGLKPTFSSMLRVAQYCSWLVDITSH